MCVLQMRVGNLEAKASESLRHSVAIKHCLNSGVLPFFVARLST